MLICTKHQAFYEADETTCLSYLPISGRWQEPICSADFAALGNGTDCYRELLAARIALKRTLAMCLPLHSSDVCGLAAMRAERPVRPNPCLKPLTRFGFVLKDRAVEIGGYGLSSELTRSSCQGIGALSRLSLPREERESSLPTKQSPHRPGALMHLGSDRPRIAAAPTARCCSRPLALRSSSAA